MLPSPKTILWGSAAPKYTTKQDVTPKTQMHCIYIKSAPRSLFTLFYTCIPGQKKNLVYQIILLFAFIFEAQESK